MIKLTGKYNNAIIYSDRPDYEACNQIQQLLDVEAFKKGNIRIMPDYHAGAGCVIGFTAKGVKNIVPNLIGVDIGCGMLALNLGKNANINSERLDEVIRMKVPSGFCVHEQSNKGSVVDMVVKNLYCRDSLKNLDRIRASIGTLGGGNHFIEMNWSDKSGLWLVIHSGSRNLGHQVASYWQKEAVRNLGGIKEEIQANLPNIEPREREAYIKEMKDKIKVPSGLEYLGAYDCARYLHDLKCCQQFASLNRSAIANAILGEFKINPLLIVESVHNYIDIDGDVIRKGAISAQKNELCVIPMNMRDGSLLCYGKGNEDWNCSAPHGAGRLMSRRQAMETISLEDYKASMSGIYSTSVNLSTMDEAPMAYKPMEEIVENIKDTVDVLEVLKPIYNFKASMENNFEKVV